MPDKPFKRILLKLSGESLKGNRSHGIDPDALDYMADEIKSVTSKGIELGIVVGGMLPILLIPFLEKYVTKSEHHIAIGDHEDLKNDLSKKHK